MDHITILGITGAFVILFAFMLNQLGKINAESRWYDSINAVGSLLLIVYAVFLNSVPFVILNTVWFVISVMGLFKK